VFDENGNFIGRMNLETNVFDGDTELKEEFKLLSFSGLHLIRPEHFSDFELMKCYVFELYKEIAKSNKVKSKFIQPNYWFDLGTQEQLKEASSWLLSQK
jgi:NDP-sugar pyrophosphorylase family protein